MTKKRTTNPTLYSVPTLIDDHALRHIVVCLLDRRVRFWRPDRMEAKGTAQDQMIWYIGYETDAFREAFEQYGAIR